MAQTSKLKHKFGGIEVIVKENIRAARIEANLDMNEASRALGFSRKILEDNEAIRNYGCHVKLNLLAAMAELYDKPIEYFFAENE
ncbi:MAG: hypothetical protein JKY40_10655 [Gammaproteobacteria bacterium]|nr:hypothetical protein [Gammaproteobacteria bacterium]MBL4729746.1 hypothetical protein [Gammaproteobacteria bacterium]